MRSPATAYLQVGKGSRDLHLNFGTPLYISGMVGDRHLKSGKHIDHQGH